MDEKSILILLLDSLQTAIDRLEDHYPEIKHHRTLLCVEDNCLPCTIDQLIEIIEERIK